MFISKSKYLAGLQCPKLLWTHFHDKEAIPAVSAATQAIFDMGHVVGKVAQRLWPDGVEVRQVRADLPGMVAETAELMRRRVPVFEAAFLVEGRYCQVDILEPGADGEWNLVEVKSGTEVKAVNLEDVAFQADTLARAGVRLGRLSVMHVDNRYVRRGEIEAGGLLRAVDVTGKCAPLMGAVGPRLAAMQATLGGDRPDTPIGMQCADPYTCPLKPACWAWLPEHGVNTLYNVRRRRVFSWLGQGVTRLVEVPDADLSAPQLVQKGAVLAGEPHVHASSIRAWLDGLRYPLWLLDFETIAPAVPLFERTRPYQRVPFQFSLHMVARPGAEPEHYEFLAETTEDPRPALLEALGRIGPDGTVLAYNMAFEKGVLRELADDFPARADFCQNLIHRMDDLILPFRAFDIYSPAQHGSCSIKSVLPAFSTISYDGLDIREGGQASAEYLRAVHGDAPADERARILDSLRVYCGQDTFAMVELLRVLERYA